MGHLTLQMCVHNVFCLRKHIPKVSRSRSHIMPPAKPWATRNISHRVNQLVKLVLRCRYGTIGREVRTIFVCLGPCMLKVRSSWLADPSCFTAIKNAFLFKTLFTVEDSAFNVLLFICKNNYLYSKLRGHLLCRDLHCKAHIVSRGNFGKSRP